MFKNKEKKAGVEELASKNNQIEKGTIIKGDVHTQGNIRIDGDVEGNIVSQAKVVLGDTSIISGNVKAVMAEISGEVKGIVEVSDLLVLKPSAVINGDIVTDKMIVESGAVFNGGCKMGAVIKDISSSDKGDRKEKTA